MRALLVIAVVGLSGFAANAGMVSYDIQEQVLTKFAQASGETSGNAGHYYVQGKFWCPTWTDPFRTCWKTVYEADLRWTMSPPTFHANNGSIAFTAPFSADFGIFHFPIFGGKTTVNGTAGITFDAGSSQLKISVNRVSVPISINFHGIGELALTTVTVNPNYGFSVPLQTMGMNVVGADGVVKRIKARPISVTPQINAGVVRINTSVAIWR